MAMNTTKKILIASGLAMAIAGAGILLVSGGTRHTEAVTVPCANRLEIVDLSSESRSGQLVAETQAIATIAALSSTVCATPFQLVGVAGGGEVLNIVDSDQIATFAPKGPNAQVRSSRLSGSDEKKIEQLVASRLAHAWASTKPATTSVEALYSTAASYSTTNTEVIITTAGVNDDSVLDMNGPLDPGAGKTDATRLAVTPLPARSVTVVGVAQMDSTAPPPSTIWPAEITSFNQTLCERSTTAPCNLYPAASATQALSPNSTSH